MHTELRRINPRKDQGKETESAAGWEQMEETFVASSTGEGMELINMVQQEDYQRLRNSAVKDLLLNQCEIIVVVTDDGNVNIYLCFKITY
uniref:Uncharacterized protein n=2 Tax=Anas TaxID=8835 RepID=A0A8B9VC62_9AVES